jgi:uncharacterized protein (TIGR03118 family)
MKMLVVKKTIVFSPLLTLLFTMCMLFVACDDDDDDGSPDARYEQVNLVSNESGYNASVVDPNLVNAWGVAVGQTGAFWIASTGKDMTTIYDYTGQIIAPAIPVPGEPTGVVYNGTSEFLIPTTTDITRFIYVGEEGTVRAWSEGNTTVEIADNGNEGAVYKGATMATRGDATYLYIANFGEGRIDVLDTDFQEVAGFAFDDPDLPDDYAPFNIQHIGGRLYVTYALQDEDNDDDVAGDGHGYINIFNTDGSFVERFASQSRLNSPWGIARVHDNFGQKNDAILVGNFGDGRINVFDEDGDFLHALKDGDGDIIEIDGLWAIFFPTYGVPAAEQDKLFFTAGPSNETDGLFGYLRKR